MSTPHKDTEIHGWTLALQTYSVLETCKVYSTKIHKFKGGYWCYKLTVSVKSAESKPYKETQIQGWTLALRTYSVREICKVCTIQRYEIDGWTLALQTCSVLEICKVYHTKIHNFKGGYWRYKLTVSLKFAPSTTQRYKLQGWMLALQICSVSETCQVYHTQIRRFKGGRWRYEPTV